MKQFNQVWAKKTLLLSSVSQVKRHSTLKQNLNMIIVFIISTIILFLYLILPLMLLFSFLQDLFTQLLCAACIFTLIEGAVGLVLLNIASSIPLHHVEHSLSAHTIIDRQPTKILLLTSISNTPTLPLTFVK